MTVCGKSLVTELSENGVSGLNETQVSGLSEIQVSDLSEISQDGGFPPPIPHRGGRPDQ